MALYEIPAEFQSELELTQPKDSRTDDEILASLREYHPVTSEKNLWAFWHSGVDSIPQWCRNNVVSWVRILGPSWTVRVVDSKPDSPNYVLKFAPAEMFPKTFLEGTMTGPYTGPHSADFVRGALLYTHGGVNMDVGCTLIRDFDRMCWDKIMDPECPYEIAVPLMYNQIIANHMVASRKGNPFIKRWHDLFVHIWSDRVSYKGISTNPLLAFLQEESLEEASSQNFTWDWKVDFATVVEYVGQVSCWGRLCRLEGIPSDPFSGHDYWMNNIMVLDVQQESWGGETTIGWDNFGERFYNLMKVKVDGDKDTPEWQEAYKVVWRLLAKSSVQKTTRGKDLTHSKHLGVFWDENPGTDCAPGTFGELLRYGSENFRQTREEVVLIEPPKPKNTMKKGLLEV